jgi:catechol 2,3-dioxygenase-like lactoylglutathione lyase family enzyme
VTPVATRFVTLSVPDLERARGTWLDALGLAEAHDLRLHGPEHEALWGLAGASRKSFAAWAGDVLVEVVEYTSPVGLPWPSGHRISDQGLLNVALGFRDRGSFRRALERAKAAGLRPNWRPFELFGRWGIVYVNDELGFSVELLYVKDPGRKAVRLNEVELGFAPKRPPVAGAEVREVIAAPLEAVWSALSDRGTAGWRIVAREPPRRLEYELEKGPWLRLCHVFVTLEEHPRGTQATFEARFRRGIPGAAVAARLILRHRARALVTQMPNTGREDRT